MSTISVRPPSVLTNPSTGNTPGNSPGAACISTCASHLHTFLHTSLWMMFFRVHSWFACGEARARGMASAALPHGGEWGVARDPLEYSLKLRVFRLHWPQFCPWLPPTKDAASFLSSRRFWPRAPFVFSGSIFGRPPEGGWRSGAFPLDPLRLRALDTVWQKRVAP